MERDVLSAGQKLREKCPDLRAAVLECGSLASYSAADLMHYAVEPERYG